MPDVKSLSRAELLAALVEKDSAEKPDNRLDIFAAIHAERRKQAHAKSKETWPKLRLKVEAEVMDSLRAEIRRPFVDGEVTPDGMDQLCLSVQDALDSGDFDDVVLALARVYRLSHAWQGNGVEPIDARLPKPQENA